VVSPVSELLPDRTTPELRHLQVTLGARFSYREAERLLRVFLPESGGFKHVTTRNRTMAIGRAIDQEIRREIVEAREPLEPAERLAVDTDGAFVKAKRSSGRSTFEIVVGRIEATHHPGRNPGLWTPWTASKHSKNAPAHSFLRALPNPANGRRVCTAPTRPRRLDQSTAPSRSLSRSIA
jgi:hypothetical protein